MIGNELKHSIKEHTLQFSPPSMIGTEPYGHLNLKNEKGTTISEIL